MNMRFSNFLIPLVATFLVAGCAPEESDGGGSEPEETGGVGPSNPSAPGDQSPVGTTPPSDPTPGTDPGPAPEPPAPVPGATYVLKTASQFGVVANATLVGFRADDASPWTTVSPTSVGTYALPVKSPRYQVAVACASSTQSNVIVLYRTAASTSVAATLGSSCTSGIAHGTITVTGVVSNAGGLYTSGGGIGTASDGSAAGWFNGDSGAYTYANARPGTWDLGVALSAAPTIATPVAASKIFFMRNVAVASNASVFNLDLATAIPTTTANLTVTGASTTWTAFPTVNYRTSPDGAGIPVGSGGNVSTAASFTRPFGVVKASARAATDRYVTVVSTRNPSVAGVFGVRTLTQAAPPTTVAVATVPAAPTLSSISASPRRVAVAIPPYGPAANTGYVVVQYTSGRVMVSDVGVGYLASGAPVTVATPDFSTWSGFSTAWGLASTGTVTSTVRATRVTALSDGEDVMQGTREVAFP